MPPLASAAAAAANLPLPPATTPCAANTAGSTRSSQASQSMLEFSSCVAVFAEGCSLIFAGGLAGNVPSQ